MKMTKRQFSSKSSATHPQTANLKPNKYHHAHSNRPWTKTIIPQGNQSKKSKVYGYAETSRSNVLSAIHTEGWFIEASNNQAMRFGSLPSWAIELSNSIREVVSYGIEEGGVCKLPPEILWRELLSDQLIVNVYHPGEGICAQVDLLRFEDGIAIISLESSCVMHFTRVGEVCDSGKGQQDQLTTKVPVYFTPGSLVLLFGDARYLWKHEINRKPGFQVWEGIKSEEENLNNA